MKTPPLSRIVEACSLLVLGGYFLYVGVIKFLDPHLFATQIDSYRLVPVGLAFYLAAGLPIYEIASAVLLIPSKTRRVGLMSILLMLATFTGALAIAWMRGLEIHCGCSGKTSISVELALLRNILFLLFGGLIYRKQLGSAHDT
jgi:putative oxidoreductase